MLETVNINKTYKSNQGDRHILKDINIKVSSGGICCILGPNGSGKSTLLNIIGGLIKQSSGDIIANGASAVQDMKRYKRNVGMLVQETYFDGFLNVYNSLIVSLYLRGIRPTKEEALRLLSLVNLEDKLKVDTRMLSGGMRRKLTLIATLAPKPPVLLLDEPTSNLDPQAREDVLNIILSMSRESGVAVLMSTHSFSEIDKVADHVVMIKDGSVSVSGTVDEVKNTLEFTMKAFIECVEGVQIPEAFVNEFRCTRVAQGVSCMVKSSGRFLDQLVSSGIKYKEVFIERASIEDVYKQQFSVL